ncbi:hypothetical protein IAT38_002783 [Cryptococcus sp. DSM 104549]
MEVSTFFTRLLQTPKEPVQTRQPDHLDDFDLAWQAIRETLEHPHERQLVRGISSTDVPRHLRHIVDALVYESNRTDEDTTGACLEYFLKNGVLASLEKLCEADRPHGIKAEVLRAINNLVVLLSERFLVHNAVHRPLRRLLRSCVGDEPEEKVDGATRVVGAAGMSEHLERERRASNEDIDGDLVDLMCILCSKMRAYPPLLLIFFHDKGWLQPSANSNTEPDPARVMSPTPSTHTAVSNPSVPASKATHHFEFLLFSYLLRFVHREGRIGDFARAGLIFLFDIAFLTPNEEGGENLSMVNHRDGTDPLQEARDALGEFILDGDFADVMAAGLGAVYSLLPTKLHVSSLASQQVPEEEKKGLSSGGMHLGSGVKDDEAEGALASDPAVHAQLDLLLKLFGFLQDIIHRCNSPILYADPNSSEVAATHVLGSAISDATLDAIQSSFLDNVLYPSVLECSSHDGSSVAVLTYLDALFSNLDDGPVLNRVLTFLMDTESSGEHSMPISTATSKKEKRKTGAMGFVSQPLVYAADYFADEGRFTLKDLLLDNLRSQRWAANTAALRLLRTLLSDHCQQSVKGLLSAVRDPAATALARKPIPLEPGSSAFDQSILPAPVNFTDIHLQEIELYGSLIARIDPSQSSVEASPGYAGYLVDMQAAIEADRCFRLGRAAFPFIGDEEKSALGRAQKLGMEDEPIQHRMSPGDPLVRAVMGEFGRFLSKTADENVAMTGVLTALALCPHRSLAGWLLYSREDKKDADPWAQAQQRRASSESDSGSDSDSDIDIDRPVAESDPFSARASIDLPAIYQILRDLVKQISRIRQEVPDFERLLSERRQGLLFADHLDEAMNIMLDVEPVFGSPITPQAALKRGKPRTSGIASSIKSFLTPKRKGTAVGLGGTPGTGTPVAGGEGTPTAGTGTGLGLGLGLSTPGSSRETHSPSPFKTHYDQTRGSISLEHEAASSGSPIATGPWSPAKQAPQRVTPRLREGSSLADELSFTADHMRDEVDVLGEEESAHGQARDGPQKVSLSRILDNCVILEEFLKEVVAVITARRALGVDQVGFV